jgi:hypothetical protein
MTAFLTDPISRFLSGKQNFRSTDINSDTERGEAMKIYDVYGLRADDFISVLPAAERRAAGYPFEERESWYLGGIYYRSGSDPAKENFSIRRNFNPAEEEWNESDFKDWAILFYVNNTERAEEIERLLRKEMPETVLIRRKQVYEKADKNELQYSLAAA